MDRFLIAKIGKTVGLWGDLKLHLETDFPQQFQIGKTFQSSSGLLEILDINLSKGLVKFSGYETLESAKRLTNTKLYTDEEQTREACKLAEGEHFWFDMIGASIYEGEELLGSVSDIQRMVGVDYLIIATEQKLIESGMVKSFMIPYIPRYIIELDRTTKQLLTQDTKEILEAS